MSEGRERPRRATSGAGGGTTDRLGQALRRLLGQRSEPGARADGGDRTAAQPAADLPSRVALLEREVGEVRTRVNALFFAVLTVALVDVVSRAVIA